MKLTVIGTGYVGLVSGVCFSELGNEVVCVDKLESKIEMLNKGEVPIYEPGLEELIAKNKLAGRLHFTTDLTSAVQRADIIIIAVGTPPLPAGEANLAYIHQAAEDIALAMNGYKIIVTKSTVPVGTNEQVGEIVNRYSKFPFAIASVPEFLREGSAVQDTLNPDRIVIGSASRDAYEKLSALHSDLTSNIILTDVRSAEMIKYASNAFLSTKISFINEIANICEKVGADVTRVAEGMGYDKRIGASFLQAGIGYGGSCFPKDTQALIHIANSVEYDFKLLQSVVEVNTKQRLNIIDKLHEALGSLQGSRIGIWGLAFKPNTDDVRDSPAIEIINKLLELGATVQVYDPIAMDNFRREITDASMIQWAENAMQAAVGCDALCLLTEWSEFSSIHLNDLARVMNQSILIDGRNSYSSEQIMNSTFEYYSVGRPNLTKIVSDTVPLAN
ncbi:UDP-glucose/GDP-mannose dehydrogenase family protein [Paenibacillus sp. ACRRY]|uniref:UDP-glucose dehydrogenase family protein n=1 Tax=Paenibacillus sp. ACRRY TaxID=2918208 RepID=UPI001EF47DE6|nr:UDP-glucose/GDP-mannose dehydrogenase family protein [Paenibacillus sp. ACRRY]MCG7385014.1 UDP-glucose/GDP-mannose dehydrogenase family protein [Paenibacillus sp. ACRRY]